MPIKWTPEVDQVLLLKILETCNVIADSDAIAAAWPENMERPTPRAVRERLAKIRTTAKGSNAAGHFSIANSSKSSNSSPAGTPRKRNANVNGNSVNKTVTPRKRGAKTTSARKRERMSDEDAADDSEGGFKSENNGSDAEDDMESPSKKAKIDGNAKIKIENAEHLDQDLTFRNSVIENLFGGDGQIDADGGLCV